MKTWHKITIPGLGLILVMAFAVAATSKPSPSDEVLRAQFLAHRGDFEALVLMAIEDNRLSRIAPDFTWLSDDVAWPRKDVGISEERWNLYRQKFRKVGASEGISKGVNPSRIIFPISSQGLVSGGSAKGLVFSHAPLAPIVSSLDVYPPDGLKDGADHNHILVYKPIDDHWYIYYEAW